MKIIFPYLHFLLTCTLPFYSNVDWAIVNNNITQCNNKPVLYGDWHVFNIFLSLETQNVFHTRKQSTFFH